MPCRAVHTIASSRDDRRRRHGRLTGTWCFHDNGAPDDRNTVENVFVESPEEGVWKVLVTGTDINTTVIQTGNQLVAHFALVVFGVDCPTCVRVPDWNSDGNVDATDLGAFLADFAKGRADVDGDGGTTPGDVAAFAGRFIEQLTKERSP